LRSKYKIKSISTQINRKDKIENIIKLIIFKLFANMKKILDIEVLTKKYIKLYFLEIRHRF
jgi:hypothetical protein